MTDEKGRVAAFLGRGCSKKSDKDAEMMSLFLEESLEFLQFYIDGTEMNVPPEDFSVDGLIKQFIKTNRKKKSAKWIDSKCREYRRYMMGGMSASQVRKYKRHSCFVKFESNIKRIKQIDDMLAGGVSRQVKRALVKARSRLIMTMSGLMQFRLCYLSNIAEAWYDGPIEVFQVKHMDPEKMISRIREKQDQAHCVTDYSAFESSIDADVRKLEMEVIRRLCYKAGYYETVRQMDRMGLDAGRTLHAGRFDFLLNTRCSGDYWTSLANGIVAICLMKFCHKRNMLDAQEFSMLAEGDDGLVPLNVPDEALLESLGFEFSSSTSGTRPGDTDFLRSLWDNKRWLNVGRVLSKIFWVKKACHLRVSKQKFLLRTMALSLHHLSPGHPVLWAVVKYIEKETRGMSGFKSASVYLDTWKEWDLSGSFPDVTCDEGMRSRVAEGADGFPPLPLTVQLQLEQKILAGDLDFQGLLSDYSDFEDNADASKPELVSWQQDDLREGYAIIGAPYVCDDLTRYIEEGIVRRPSKRDTCANRGNTDL